MRVQVLQAQVAARREEALQALFRHPERTLLPWYRYALYAALVEDDAGAGLRTRAWLDVLAARKVLFCWQPFAASTHLPVRMQPDVLLALAADTLRGATTLTAVQPELNRALALSDVAGERPSSPHYAVWCVYEASARALESACIAVGQPDGPTIALADAAGYAAIAVAGGEGRVRGQPEAEDEDARLRRAVFWEWWLREALPEAVARARSMAAL
jgi:hypothetical protein